MKGLIFDIQRFSIHDGHGIRTVVFFKGCPLSCPWCCNPESINNFAEIGYEERKCIKCKSCVNICKDRAINFSGDLLSINKDKCNLCGLCLEDCHAGALRLFGRPVTAEELIETVLKDRAFYDSSGGGVTISGGEPMAQPEFLKDLLVKLKKHKINTAIETSGYCEFRVFEKIIQYLDCILFDLKIFDREKHKNIIGVDNKKIHQNFLKLADYGDIDIIARIPVIPGFTDDKANISNILNLIKLNKKVRMVHFLPYHRFGISKYKQLGRTYKLEKIKPLAEFKPDKEMAALLESSNINYKIGG